MLSSRYLVTDTELAYNRYRYYAPSTACYISRDTIGQAGGNPALYAFVKNINTEVDIFGLENDFLQDVQNSISRIGQKFQRAEIYVFDKKTTFKGIRYNKGDYFYLDNFHKDHYEVFDSKNKSKAVINLDGSLNEKKTKNQKIEQGVEGNSLIIKNKNGCNQ